MRPIRSNIKSGNAFLERARYVISPFRKMFWAEQLLQSTPTENENRDDICEVYLLKQNNGPIGKRVEALFDAEHFDFIPITNTVGTP